MPLITNQTAYYKLDEASGNAADATGNGNTLVNTGTVGYVAGKINNGVDFTNTAGKHLKVESNLGLTSTSSSTVNFWVKYDTNTGYLIDWFTQSGAQRRYIIYFDGTQHFRTYFQAVDNPAIGPALSSSTWYMCTLVITTGSSALFYINATSYGSPGGMSNGGGALNRFSIGGAGDSDGAPADAIFDEVGVWDRALSGSEITELYNAGAGTQYPYAPAFFARSNMRPNGAVMRAATI